MRLQFLGSDSEEGECPTLYATDRAIGLPDHDYWLFDSRKLAWMHFDDTDDRFLGAEIIEDSAAIVQHNYWRDAARHWAVRRDDFAAEYDK